MFDMIPSISPKFNRDYWWPAIKAQTEWILYRETYKRLYLSEPAVAEQKSIMDDIRTLGERLMPDVPIPKPSAFDSQDWMRDVQEYVLSMVVAIISKFIVMCTEDTGGALLGDWPGMHGILFNHEGCVNKSVQLQFAESIRYLVAVAPWNQPMETAAAQIFRDWIWRFSLHWFWITDLKSAQILAGAVRRHKNDPNFRGTIWCEQALLDRCLKIISDAAEHRASGNDGYRLLGLGGCSPSTT
jgi:hypothetical protein